MNWQVLAIVEGFIIGFFAISWAINRRFNKTDQQLRRIESKLDQLFEPLPKAKT
jgi:hypothetical protein